MRVNVYHEELTRDVQVVEVNPDTSRTYIGLRLYLESSLKLHDSAEDDDRSAVTIWFGTTAEIEYFVNDVRAGVLDYFRAHP